MNGYDLIAKMRKTRRKHPLTATEQALYNELVAMCNEVEWNDVFTCSNYELCNSLAISENTLTNARNRLIQTGLIFYKSGKSKRQFSSYSFTVKFSTTSKFDTNTGTNTGTVTGTVRPVTTSNSEDYYKQTKQKQFINKECASENEISVLEIQNTIEFIARVKQTNLTTDQVLNFWEAFKLNEAETAYLSKHKKIQHFRNWLKNQKQNANNSITRTGTSAARIDALRTWGT